MRESGSPLLGAGELSAYGRLPGPRPHTGAELAAVTRLLAPDVRTVAVGHGRDGASRAAAEAFAAVWRARGGTVAAVVNWPETAASWLRAARRLTEGEPDGWVMAAALPGFAQLARRLRHSTGWDPSRTVAFASLHDSRLPALAGPDAVHGLRGATSGGGTWEIRGGWLVEGSALGAGRGRLRG
ncbi:ABC transporter substrate-binding protein [Streptomyces sp. NPDC048172]|uniref:ABC transporter substrate-binding protein n=1 Tax=Streptomyces sp. NPDC048172 TaxID=3365505 RepID=UPI00371D2663